MIKDLSRGSWELFVTRPATLLERAMRCPGYHRAGLKRIFSISESGLCQIFVDSDEWNILERQSVKLLRTGRGKFRLREYRDRLGSVRKFVKVFLRSKNIDRVHLKKIFDLYAKVTEVIIFTHLLEKQVDNQDMLRKYRHVVGYLHDTARLMIDLLYDSFLQKMKRSDLDWYLPQEIWSGTKPSKKAIVARKRYYVLFSRKDNLILWTGSKAKRLGNLIREISQQRVGKLPSSQISGSPVFKGKVRGQVLVVRLLSDLKKVRPSLIVVSPMTEPRMNPYLKRVRAIITDEGGLTSHAAIFAREMKIPSIVGTKIATKVLKDGDLVEVDAERGVVRLFKKAK